MFPRDASFKMLGAGGGRRLCGSTAASAARTLPPRVSTLRNRGEPAGSRRRHKGGQAGGAGPTPSAAPVCAPPAPSTSTPRPPAPLPRAEPAVGLAPAFSPRSGAQHSGRHAGPRAAPPILPARPRWPPLPALPLRTRTPPAPCTRTRSPGPLAHPLTRRSRSGGEPVPPASGRRAAAQAVGPL